LPADRFESDAAREFAKCFREQCGHEPDYAAAQTCDAVSMLVAAVRKVGPNRVRIAEALRELSPYQGVAGTIRWDRVGANTRPVRLGVYRDGLLVEAE
jgi:ABC-type branched-subunit amino acid transport system substrate-binding protein